MFDVLLICLFVCFLVWQEPKDELHVLKLPSFILLKVSTVYEGRLDIT